MGTHAFGGLVILIERPSETFFRRPLFAVLMLTGFFKTVLQCTINSATAAGDAADMAGLGVWSCRMISGGNPSCQRARF
jgi:hypothetical protein